MTWLLYNLLLHVDHRRWYRKFTVSTLLDKLSETRYWVQCIIINIIINDPAFSNNSYPLIYQPVLTIWLHCTSGLSYYFSLTTPRQSNSSTSFFFSPRMSSWKFTPVLWMDRQQALQQNWLCHLSPESHLATTISTLKKWERKQKLTTRKNNLKLLYVNIVWINGLI